MFKIGKVEIPLKVFKTATVQKTIVNLEILQLLGNAALFILLCYNNVVFLI